MMKKFKLVTFVPESHADSIRRALGDMGIGKMGKYTHGSFSVKGKGRFMATNGTHPYSGEFGEINEVDEERIEVVCFADKIKEAVRVIKEIHPYEEVPVDIHPALSEEYIEREF